MINKRILMFRYSTRQAVDICEARLMFGVYFESFSLRNRNFSCFDGIWRVWLVQINSQLLLSAPHFVEGKKIAWLIWFMAGKRYRRFYHLKSNENEPLNRISINGIKIIKAIFLIYDIVKHMDFFCHTNHFSYFLQFHGENKMKISK